MDLTPEQKATVAGWAAEGLDLSDIQKKLEAEMGVVLTYLETRMLVADLELHHEDPEPESTDDLAASPISPGAPDPVPPGAEPGSNDLLGGEPAPGGGVSVTLDTVAQPHAIASGKVTFSDGETAGWSIDELGRLGLDPATPGYRPAESDLMDFQMELRRVAESQGL